MKFNGKIAQAVGAPDKKESRRQGLAGGFGRTKPYPEAWS
jgi:hypothetical protein